MKHYLYILFTILLASCQMKTAAPGIEEALSRAGDNRGELLRVLQHYEERGDSLKLRAAEFLIGNMADKGYLTGRGIDEYYHFIDSVYQIKQPEYDIPYLYGTFRQQAKYLKEKPIPAWDTQTLSADYLIQNIDEAFAVWNRPWNQHLTFEEFCEWVLPYRVGTEIPETWRTLYRERFEPLLLNDSIQTAKQACEAINNELIKLPIHIAEDAVLPIDLRASTLLNMKFGLCNDYANLAVYAMRAAGIPVGIETVPHWGDENRGHIFNVVYDNDGTYHDFSGGEHNPDEHLVHFRPKITKIYKRTFGKHPASLAMQHGNEDIPDFFQDAYRIDVTDDYPFIQAQDITVDLQAATKRQFAYLCVFNPNGWVPVAWGKVKGEQAEFKAIGPKIIYHAALFADGKLQLTGYPFLLDTLGQITYFKPQAEAMEYTLERKYRDAYYLNYLPPIMVGGKFQGANQPDFSDAVTLYAFTEEPNFKYTTVESATSKPFKYVRYQASPNTTGNIAELEFYAEGSDTPLKGKVIGDYKPSLAYPRYGAQVMFDGDPLTFFHSSDSASWGGLELEQPTAINKIRYIIRNDDNGIRKGHEYELFYMKDGEWVSLGKQTATEDDRLFYQNMPKGALYWLRDYTKGKEERIFIIENNQVKWY
ncbi:hypothetical protein B5F77_15010 [Parabacteroides sp. An277]|uniref:transglutaminase domain-containing protein n=1 Tax=Parabacteroides sp. An277 TaxID=1965619 RepID=UPI000B37F1CA|nr:transglutaminase domain-containing protein [Parabacteroides sp. An277]OUO49328.1 hypothetical protein B5F77_15010 [Parabacteroides sp. An277]